MKKIAKLGIICLASAILVGCQTNSSNPISSTSGSSGGGVSGSNNTSNIPESNIPNSNVPESTPDSSVSIDSSDSTASSPEAKQIELSFYIDKQLIKTKTISSNDDIHQALEDSFDSKGAYDGYYKDATYSQLIRSMNDLVIVGNKASVYAKKVEGVIVTDTTITGNDDQNIYHYLDLNNLFNNGKRVTAIAPNAFQDTLNLYAVFIPETIQTIGADAFNGCINLAIYSEPSSKLEGWAESWSWTCPVVWVNGQIKLSNGFYYSDKNDGTTTIVSYDYLKGSDVKVPSMIDGLKVVAIGDYSFYMLNMTDVTIPEGVTSIGKGAFYEISYLSTVNLPSTLTSIGELAFYHCEELPSITLPGGVTSIGANAFEMCAILASINLPLSVVYVGANAFLECPQLTIDMEATEIPSSWDANWNPDGRPVNKGVRS